MKIKTIIWLAIFSIAMGYMESSIVIYLRKIYYPDGFGFPLAPLDTSIGLVEVLREAATMIMLLAIGVLVGRTASTKFAVFIYCFAIWDLFYYLFLWVFLGWPNSLLTWDILFLIPVPWVGPVLTPIIVAVTMLGLALAILQIDGRGFVARLRGSEWFILCLGSLIVILSFVWDYFRYVRQQTDLGITSQVLGDMQHYIPKEFNWLLFLVGEAVILYGIVIFVIRKKPRTAY